MRIRSDSYPLWRFCHQTTETLSARALSKSRSTEYNVSCQTHVRRIAPGGRAEVYHTDGGSQRCTRSSTCPWEAVSLAVPACAHLLRYRQWSGYGTWDCALDITARHGVSGAVETTPLAYSQRVHDSTSSQNLWMFMHWSSGWRAMREAWRIRRQRTSRSRCVQAKRYRGSRWMGKKKEQLK